MRRRWETLCLLLVLLLGTLTACATTNQANPNLPMQNDEEGDEDEGGEDEGGEEGDD